MERASLESDRYIEKRMKERTKVENRNLKGNLKEKGREWKCKRKR